MKLGVPPFEGNDTGGGDGKSGGVYPKEVEYGRTVYFDAANYGLVPGGREESMEASWGVVVVTGDT